MKTLNAELMMVTELKEQLTDQNQVLEEVVERKDKEMSELVNRINDTIKEYEQKLAHKEEQIMQINEKLAEGLFCQSEEGGVGWIPVHADPPFLLCLYSVHHP